MSQQLHTETTINARPDEVWAVLEDFAAYPSWNPFIRQISGRLETGDRLEVELAPPGGRAMTMRPTVREVQPGHGFRWLGSVGVRGVFDGEHSFQVEPLGEGQVRFVQSERFSGILSPLIMAFIGRSTRQGFEAMNQALKERAEARAASRVGAVA
jgi:hypothetical protein